MTNRATRVWKRALSPVVLVVVLSSMLATSCLEDLEDCYGGAAPERITENVELTESHHETTNYEIPANRAVSFKRDADITLSAEGSIIVRGVLFISPDALHTHLVHIVGASDGAMDAGVMPPAPPPATSDADYRQFFRRNRGLFVLGEGLLCISGQAKTSRARATTESIVAEASSVTVSATPTGWKDGDSVVITPTAVDDTVPEKRTIDIPGSPVGTALTSATVPLSAPLSRAHPPVALPDGSTRTAEVLNLTRNAKIEGTEPDATSDFDYPTSSDMSSAGAKKGRSHVFIMNYDPDLTDSLTPAPSKHRVLFTEIAHMGPRVWDEVNSHMTSRDVKGRYGLHFHMGGDQSKGSIVYGTVVRDSGSHAFVAHKTNGILFQETIAYQTSETAYWWDLPGTDGGAVSGSTSKDIHYVDAVAARVSIDQYGFTRLAGFDIGCGPTSTEVSGSTSAFPTLFPSIKNTLQGGLATGVLGRTQASGFNWPESHLDCKNQWTFNSSAAGPNVAHNNAVDGIFTWQNHPDLGHLIEDFVGYRNQGQCIEHGAYINIFDYDDVVCAGNRGHLSPYDFDGEVVLHANSTQGLGQVTDMTDFVLDMAPVDTTPPSGYVKRALTLSGHSGASTAASRLKSWTIKNAPSTGLVKIAERLDLEAGRYDLLCWNVKDSSSVQRGLVIADFSRASGDDMHPGTVIYVENPPGSFNDSTHPRFFEVTTSSGGDPVVTWSSNSAPPSGRSTECGS